MNIRLIIFMSPETENYKAMRNYIYSINISEEEMRSWILRKSSYENLKAMVMIRGGH